MNFPKNDEDFTTRRNSLAREIALQRGELARVYSELRKPISYVEYGMKGVGFIRQNRWILTFAPSLLGSLPSLFNLVLIALGSRKKKRATWVNPPPRPASAIVPKKISRVSQALMTGAEQCVRAYELYRRVRSVIS